MVRAMCGVHIRDIKRANDLMLVLGLSETIDQFAMASCFHWYVYVLRREDGHVLRRAFDFEVEGQEKKRWLKRTCKKQVEEESMKFDLSRKMNFDDQSGLLVLI